MDFLPIQYHLEIYENSFVNDVSLAFSSHSPFQNFSVGDYFNHQLLNCWYTELKKDETFQVKIVEHIMWKIENSHIGHKVMVCLELTKQTG
ncbi:hypothetical protein [Trichormus sp. NMC-1]|uniref:hypothetical protein n=1 Tax=Trichormus sp. NMC-1 TaxID=1853259 RepID=UPI0008DC25FC|nr:hypothetical protein [Trichormus sp. NMC-1]